MSAKRKMLNFIYYFKKAWNSSRSYLLINILRNFFNAVISLFNIAGLGIVIDALSSGKSEKTVLFFIFIYVGLNLMITLTNQVILLFENNVMRKTSNVIQFAYMKDSIDIDYHYVQNQKILNLKKRSMIAHPVFSLSILGDIFNYIIQMGGIVVIFLSLSPLFILIIMFMSAVLIWLSMYTQKCDFDFNTEKVENERKLSYIYDVMTKYQYAKEIRINNAKSYIKKKYTDIFSAQIVKLNQLLKRKFGVNLLSTFISVLQSAVMYIYFTYQACYLKINIAQYTVMLASATLFTGVLLKLFKALGTVNNCLKAAEYLREYEDTVNKNSNLNGSNNLSEKKIDFSNSVIRFENVSFKYPDTSYYILKNINVEISEHKRLGIVGLNGSGKTTFIKLILRIYTPTEGKITLNGINISDIPYKQYSEHLGAVLQDYCLFAYSVIENIVFDGVYHSAALTDCIFQSGLAEKVKNLPNGIKTSVYRDLDDDGIEFSGGEGQKLAMARMLYKNADILILDEPSSALDPYAEYELFTHLSDISRGKTTIFISHRLSSVQFCDKIIVLNEGAIIEEGTHKELLNRKGFYSDLYYSQAKYYRKKR